MGLFSRSSKVAEAQRVAEEAAEFERLGRRAFDGVTPISDTLWRSQVKVAGRVKAMRVQPWAEKIASLEITLADETGGLTVVFLGRRAIGGIHLGSHIVVEGMVSEVRHQLTLINPAYQLLPHLVHLPY
jgi:RecG-like helicase